jgi:hypothetical protein
VVISHDHKVARLPDTGIAALDNEIAELWAEMATSLLIESKSTDDNLFL